jgi:thiamine biosynthesis lipoprotein
MVKKLNLIFLLVALLVIETFFAQNTYKQKLILMGSSFTITVLAENEKQSDEFIGMAINEIKRIERLISSWDSNSQTSLINKNAGIQPIKVDLELFNLIERAIKVSKLTDGAFDISYASMDKIWKFDGSLITMPSEEAIQKSVAKVGYQNIILDKPNTTIFLKLKGMKIGFGGIGKGYAADKAKKLLQQKGVKAGIINASGDMNVWGKQADGKPWKVGITNPLNKNKIFALFPLENRAVVTSGNYEKYAVFNNKRYTHIIDPRSGMPSSGIVSVSVFAPNAELADALATSVFVTGIDVGLHLINQIKNIDCIIVTDDGKIYSSDKININSKNYLK